MEHLVFRLILLLDDLFRTPLRSAVPDLNELRDDPAGYFARNGGVTVGPRRRYLISLIVGGALGLVVGWLVGAGFGAVLNNNARAWEWVVRLIAVVAGMWIGPVVAWHVSRGGELHLLPSGAVFSYRGADVVCPWDALDPGRPAANEDDNWTRLPVRPDAVDRITLLTGGEVVQAGRDLDASHVRAAKRGFFGRLLRGEAPMDSLLVRDVYAVGRGELLALVLQVAAGMGGEVREDEDELLSDHR